MDRVDQVYSSIATDALADSRRHLDRYPEATFSGGAELARRPGLPELEPEGTARRRVPSGALEASA